MATSPSTTGSDHFQKKINAASHRAVGTSMSHQASTTGAGNFHKVQNKLADKSVTTKLLFNGTDTKNDFRIALNKMSGGPTGAVGKTHKTFGN